MTFQKPLNYPHYVPAKFSDEQVRELDSLADLRKQSRSATLRDCVEAELQRVRKSGGSVVPDRDAIAEAFTARVRESVVKSGATSRLGPEATGEAIQYAVDGLMKQIETVLDIEARVADLEAARNGGGRPLS